VGGNGLSPFRGNSRPVALLSSALFVALGACFIGLGMFARLRGGRLFGVAIVLFGLSQALTLLRLEPGWIQPLTISALTVSVVMALVSLVVQIRDRRRTPSQS
jgi:hypothetical protein